METSIDDDYFGCWSGRTLNFKESAIENSSLILKFKRKMQWHDEMQEFRYYFNKENKMRIIMLDIVTCDANTVIFSGCDSRINDKKNIFISKM